jgi:tetratricopeptide (TPR) repeat protein
MNWPYKVLAKAMRVDAFLLTFALLSAPILAEQDMQQELRAHYEKAQSAVREGRYEESENEYLAVLKLDPSLAEARANLGIVYYLDSKYPQAARTLKEALKLRPNLTRARLYLGLSQFPSGEYRSSVDSLQEALSGGLDPPFQKLARANLARDYLALDQTEKAIAILKALVEQYPQDTDLLYTLGKSYLRLSAAAAEKLTRAGDTARLHEMLAENFVNQGKFKEAIDEYLTALSRPENARRALPVGAFVAS